MDRNGHTSNGHSPRTDAVNAQQAAPWPEGTIARYLTVGGAIVELTDGPDSIKGTCAGCPESEWPYPFSYDPMCEGFRMESYTRHGATAWAQAHAEKCRAMPRPAVTA
jgi:hypothetical protein